MPTAPSFTSYEKMSEPFDRKGKRYITVKHPTTGNLRDVRWYTDSEYAKAYGKKETVGETSNGFDGLAGARGFRRGPILCARGYRPTDERWLEQSIARYAVGVGWYIASDDEFPLDAPASIKFVPLSWEEFRLNDDRHMKSPEELDAIINKKYRNKSYLTIDSYKELAGGR